MKFDIYIKKSSNPTKKYSAYIYDQSGNLIKRVRFGAKGYSDFTIHKDVNRKNRYIRRHSKRENWNDFLTPGFYARWILWNKPSLDASIKDLNNRYKNLRFHRSRKN